MEEEGDKEGGEEDEGESEEESSEGVLELETEGEPTLSETELCWQRWDLYWEVEEAWLDSG